VCTSVGRSVLLGGAAVPVLQRGNLHEGADQGGNPPGHLGGARGDRPLPAGQHGALLAEAEGRLLRSGPGRQL